MRASSSIALAAVLLALGAAVVVYVATGTHESAGTPDAGIAALPLQVDAGEAEGPHARPDILLFTIDTLRADHVGSYGYRRATTPTIDAVAARGTRFTRAYSTSNWTVPAMASLVTGLIPSEHGVVHAFIQPDGLIRHELLSSTLPTFAQTLHDVGYRTVGITANGNLAPELGYGRGFDVYRNVGFYETDVVRPAVATELEALRDSPEPYLLWVHVMDPHPPYTPIDPQFTAFSPPGRTRVAALDTMILPTQLRAIARQQNIPVLDALDYVVTAYDSEIREVDDYLEELVTTLDDGNLAIVITSDHGEEFGDHFSMSHGATLFQEVVQVPLVLSVPGRAPSVSPGIVSIVDVLPTLAELGDAPAPARSAGRSLLPATRGVALPTTRDLVLEAGQLQTLHALIDGHYELGERTRPRPIEMLFDLDNDPTELHPCQDAHPDIATAMRTRLHAALEEAARFRPEIETTTSEIPPEMRAQIEAQGTP